MFRFKLGKGIIAAAISFSLLFTASVTIIPQNVEAAYSVSKANSIISKGKSYWGRPYVYGASTSTTRVFDCSSFTKRLFAQQGIYLPRTSKDQAKRGYYVAKRNLKKGDLVFYSTSNSRGKIAHVAIYAGNGNILHTYKKGVGVTMTKMSKNFWEDHYKTARRVIN